jgi:hypothetical protein
VFIFKPLLLHTGGKNPKYPLDMRLSGSQRSLDSVEEKALFFQPGIESR